MCHEFFFIMAQQDEGKQLCPKATMNTNARKLTPSLQPTSTTLMYFITFCSLEMTQDMDHLLTVFTK